MIVTVTMNPAIDKTVDIGKFERGDLNRINRVEIDAGGKGINVSKTIRELGGESIATGFVGGTSGTIIKQVLTDLGLRTDFVEVKGETRTNLKVVEETGEVTELNEPGPEVSKEQLEDLLNKL
ncbi:MAG: 1-phosphofructokinase, partial [Paenibacillaceae bacterium]|nr:1-phosphofructokinase [Paenibacillaceae bacterium]